jgi:hypothetical protein
MMNEVEKIKPLQMEKEAHFPEDPASPQAQNKSMEVQKHPHHVMHKKKWFEYLLEFLMIFLAVFLGFFAENIREHTADKERLLKGMHTMIGTLKHDIGRYGEILWENATICKGLDSFRHEIDEALAGRLNPNKLYYFHWRYGRGWSDVTSHVSAMSQLQNSGMLRLIKNDTLVYGISLYYEELSAVLNNQKAELIRSRDELWKTYNLFFDLHSSKELVDRDTIVTVETPVLYNYYIRVLERKPALKLLSSNPKELKRLYMDLTVYEIELHRFNSWIRTCLYSAGRLMKYILVEYNLNTGKDEGRYASIGIVGSATAKGWNTSTPMQLSNSETHQWQDTLKLTEGEVKFRADNRWDINWGNSFFPNGIAIQNGANIPIPAEGKYNITFNDITGEYTFTIVSTGKP